MGGGNAAYNLRKMAPRILIAFIGVQLSFFLSSLMIDIFNGLGSGVANLFYQIADANNIPIVDTTAIQGGQLGQGAAILALGSGAAAGLLLSGGGIAGLVPAMMGFGVMALIVVVVAGLTLVLRQIIIVGMVIISPLAFVAYLVPNLEQYFKKWWSSYIKLLMMYPLIVGLFGVGKIAGQIASITAANATGQPGNGGIAAGPTMILMAFLANVIPLGLVPSTLKFGGGIMAAGGNIGRQLGQKSRKNIRENDKILSRTKGKAANRVATKRDRIDAAKRTKSRSQYGMGKALGHVPFAGDKLQSKYAGLAARADSLADKLPGSSDRRRADDDFGEQALARNTARVDKAVNTNVGSTDAIMNGFLAKAGNKAAATEMLDAMEELRDTNPDEFAKLGIDNDALDRGRKFMDLYGDSGDHMAALARHSMANDKAGDSKSVDTMWTGGDIKIGDKTVKGGGVASAFSKTADGTFSGAEGAAQFDAFQAQVRGSQSVGGELGKELGVSLGSDGKASANFAAKSGMAGATREQQIWHMAMKADQNQLGRSKVSTNETAGQAKKVVDAWNSYSQHQASGNQAGMAAAASQLHTLTGADAGNVDALNQQARIAQGMLDELGGYSKAGRIMQIQEDAGGRTRLAPSDAAQEYLEGKRAEEANPPEDPPL